MSLMSGSSEYMRLLWRMGTCGLTDVQHGEVLVYAGMKSGYSGDSVPTDRFRFQAYIHGS